MDEPQTAYKDGLQISTSSHYPARKLKYPGYERLEHIWSQSLCSSDWGI